MSEVQAEPVNLGSNGLVSKLKANPFFLACIFNFAALLVCFCCFRIRYEASDDYMIDAILSGAFGYGYSPYLLWGNPILGNILVAFYKLIPDISFYFVLLILLGFLSSTSITYLLFKKGINAVSVCISLIYLCVFSEDIYVLLQFTKISAIAGIAGGLLIVHGIWEEKNKKIRFVVLGTLLALLGSMVRFSTVYIYGAFLLVTFLYYSVIHIKNNAKSDSNKKSAVSSASLIQIGKRLLICIVIVAFLFGCEYLGNYIRVSDQKLKDFNDFQSLRYGITDTIKPEYDDAKEDFDNLGLDYIDFCMLSLWQFVDKDVYSNETLSDVGVLLKNHSSNQTHNLSYILTELIERNILIYPAALALYVFVVIALASGKRRAFPLVLFLTAFIFFVYFIYTGRTVYRVEWSVYYCAAVCFLSTYKFNLNCFLAKHTFKAFGKSNSYADIGAILIILILFGVGIPNILPNLIIKNMSDEEYQAAFDSVMSHSGFYLKEKTPLLTTFRNPEPNLINLMENDPDHFYYVDFFTGTQSLYFNYDPWIRPKAGLFRDDYAYFGSVVMHFPDEREALIANGADPDSPYKSLVNNNILLVDNKWANLKLDYIRKYYYPDAEIELVDQVDGFSIWNIYLPENKEVT